MRWEGPSPAPRALAAFADSTPTAFVETIMRRAARIAIAGACILSALAVATALPSLLAARNLWALLSTDYLSVTEVCQRWGERPLDVAAFRLSEEDPSTRAAMACTLRKNQDEYIGMHHLQIQPLFGDHPGYHATEVVPTYLIETAETEARDSWQIVFPLDQDRNVSDVVVHKNCC